MPRISVVIPHYNDPASLRLCLDALERQTVGRDAFEVIVGDNNSPCGLAAVEDAVAGRARIVTVMEKGAGPARNGAAAEARGDILAFTDSDCVVEPGWLAAGAAQIAPGTFLGGHMYVLQPAGRPNGVAALEMALSFDNEGYVRRTKFTVTANLFVMRADFERVGGFRTGVSEDLEWCHRAIARGLTIDYAADASVGHPPRPDWAALLVKSRRIQQELFLFNIERPKGRLRWLARSVLQPALIPSDAAKILRTPGTEGARGRAIAMLVALRFWRGGAGLLQLLGRNI
ncbi:glycosyltransferase family 2 protein [Sphingomonas sp. TDK1]|uniref:glycosyltransferase family 2 protein n=1 Tax=Sphingomonas sp. TDK1 TaxID=453247 RepID=UPI0007D9EFB9|nr:glycosyltransferase [Sphingomonas sp. TDK1]OAN66846.1 family 2 glycosyl transferase [Sphingomonas sp. TDK1]